MNNQQTLRYASRTALVCIGLFTMQPSSGADSPVIKINEATAKAEVKSDKLRGNLTMLSGSGGNIIVYNSPAGKFVVDSGISVSKDKILSALSAIGPEPLKYLVNTHYHWDHSDGNVWMHEAGATIVGAPQTAHHLGEQTRVEDWNYTFKPLPAAGRPTVLVKGSKTIKFGGETFHMQNFGNGHTDGDLWVYAQKADVLILGDTYWHPYYPFIDNKHGGSINNAIKWADKAIEASTDKTIIVPGHGVASNKTDLKQWRAMLADIRDKVAAMKKQGKSLEEIQATKPTSAYDAKYGGFVIDGNFFTKLVFDGL
ncbi:MBL fold metallo-hydrolase [Cupriavidus sp. H39]|uniref:MBL fold metallo-hydrolase n=1 Tax=Cupriavidus sp. H39 TaxID=3401635 RepID=UPI003D0251E7